MGETDGDADPTVVDSVAVSAADLVAALETNRTTDRTAVLRITPPFAARMRARLHVESEGGEGYDRPRPIHVPPRRLVAEDAPAYPRPADTEDELRASDTEYTIDRHRRRHEAAVEEWRQTLLAAVRERAAIDTPDGPVDVTVHLLGDGVD
jgi:hypothetical protein